MTENRYARVFPSKAAVSITVLQNLGRAGACRLDRENGGLYACGGERFAEPRHSVGRPTVDLVQSSDDMYGTERIHGLTTKKASSVCPPSKRRARRPAEERPDLGPNNPHSKATDDPGPENAGEQLYAADLKLLHGR